MPISTSKATTRKLKQVCANLEKMQAELDDLMYVDGVTEYDCAALRSAKMSLIKAKAAVGWRLVPTSTEEEDAAERKRESEERHAAMMAG